MRRILLLITDLEIGGTPTVVREIATRLRGDADIQVACLSEWGPVADELQAAGIRVTALNAQHRFDFRIVRTLLERIDADRIDTVFSFLIHANALAAVAKILRPQLRILQSIQTTQPTPRWHWWLQAFCERAAEWVIVPSHSVALAAHDWSRVPTAKIRVIPNAVEPPLSLIPVLNDADVFRIGFIGRLDPIKRIEDLIQAVARLPARYVLTIYGSGADAPRLQQLVARLGLAERIEFKGSILSPWTALAAMDVLVLPSDAEGFGLVLIEAMAVGVPVVATDVAGIRDVVRHARTGLLVPPRDPNGLTRAIRQIADDPALRERLTAAAKEEVARRYGWASVLPEYLEVLTKECARRDEAQG